jgi:hypothetical protein
MAFLLLDDRREDPFLLRELFSGIGVTAVDHEDGRVFLSEKRLRSSMFSS